MKWVFIALALFFISPQLGAQEKQKKIKAYKIWLKKMDGSKVKGFLFEANEQGVTINKGKTLDAKNLITIPPSEISTIRIRRKAAVGRGAGFGLLAGGIVGVSAGYISGDDDGGWFAFDKEDKAVIGGVFWGIVGSGVGALVGSSKKLIVIFGDSEKYQTHLNSLVNYDLVPD